MVDFVEIDDFFSASGTFLNGDGDLDCQTTTMVGGYDTEGSSPEHVMTAQFSPDMYGGSPESYISGDDTSMVPASMSVETPPHYPTADPPVVDPQPTDTPASFNPFEDVATFQDDTMMGSRTTNPLYDSNEALNQLDLLAQPDAMAMSVSPMAAAAPQQQQQAAVAPSSKKKRKAARSIKQEASAAAAPATLVSAVPTMAVDMSAVAANMGGPPKLMFTARKDVGTKLFSDTGEVNVTEFEVEADKGFNFSSIDNAFVCQKKNHFQVSATAAFNGVPTTVMVVGANGQAEYAQIQQLKLAIWGIKDEVPPGSVAIEQSHVDRSKRPFVPEPIDFAKGARHHSTFSRLHFGETTAYNMRKKGKPNPDQRYFRLLVELHATTADNRLVSIFCMESDRIIVRASNPGQFDGETEMKWVKGKVADSIVHHGPVGINTDRPFSALTVNGNVAVTGSLMHPSDLRIKEQLEPMDNKQQLENVKAMRLYEYQVREPWAEAAGRDTEDRREVGVIAQNMQQVLPDAVKETGENIGLSDGSQIDNLLIVDKDRIFMENVGAVQELCRMSENMDNRIRELEILRDSVTSGQYYQAEQLEGDFGYGDTRRGRAKQRKALKNKKKMEEAKRGEWETLTPAQPGWQQIPVKAKETFPIERLICYIIGVLVIFALLIIIVVLVSAKDDGGEGMQNLQNASTIPTATLQVLLDSSTSTVTTMTETSTSLTESLPTLTTSHFEPTTVSTTPL